MSDGDKMVEQMKSGDKLAEHCLSLYKLHYSVPEDACARVLFNEAYKEWKKRESRRVERREPADEL